MGVRKLTEEQLLNLKFADCRSCRFVLTKACRGCDVGENFEDADEPEAADEFMQRYG